MWCSLSGLEHVGFNNNISHYRGFSSIEECTDGTKWTLTGPFVHSELWEVCGLIHTKYVGPWNEKFENHWCHHQSCFFSSHLNQMTFPPVWRLPPAKGPERKLNRRRNQQAITSTLVKKRVIHSPKEAVKTGGEYASSQVPWRLFTACLWECVLLCSKRLLTFQNLHSKVTKVAHLPAQNARFMLRFELVDLLLCDAVVWSYRTLIYEKAQHLEYGDKRSLHNRMKKLKV